jgi:hypothetical protein
MKVCLENRPKLVFTECFGCLHSKVNIQNWPFLFVARQKGFSVSVLDPFVYIKAALLYTTNISDSLKTRQI